MLLLQLQHAKHVCFKCFYIILKIIASYLEFSSAQGSLRLPSPTNLDYDTCWGMLYIHVHISSPEAPLS